MTDDYDTKVKENRCILLNVLKHSIFNNLVQRRKNCFLRDK